VDHAIEVMPAVEAFLTQAMDTSPTFDETLRALAELAARIDLQQLGGAAR
jgi:flagellar biosynthesis/type III secretory pathway ATPase